MAPSQATEDYYKFLGIPQSAGTDAIRASYRKLALKYHPDRNPNNPQATAQFQLLEAAYSTLFDPERRRAYDLQYESIKRNSATDTGKNPPPPQSNSNNSDQLYKIQIAKLEAAIQQLRNREDELASQLAKAKKEHSISQVALGILQQEADRVTKEEANRNSWYGYFFAKKQSEEEKQATQRRMVDNRAARSVREAELKRLVARVLTTQSQLDDIQRRVREKVDERHRLQIQEMKRQQDIRLAEVRRQQAMQREREERAREDAERRRKEEQVERLRKAQEAERVWREQEAERIRRAQEAERIRRTQEAERIRRAQEARYYEGKWDAEGKWDDGGKWDDEESSDGEGNPDDDILFRFWDDVPNRNFYTEAARQGASQTKARGQRSQRGQGPRAGSSTGGQSAKGPERRKSSCLHRSWWAEVEGRHECERCLETTRRFAFCCPGCHMVACAGCRDTLKRGW